MSRRRENYYDVHHIDFSNSIKFEIGDVLTVFCLRDDISKVENLFQVGVDFF